MCVRARARTHACAHADHVSTQCPLELGRCGLSVHPPNVPSEPSPRRVPEGGRPLTWITVSSPSGDCSAAASPSPGSLEAELILDGSAGLGRKPGLGYPVSLLPEPWPGRDPLQCTSPTPARHLAPPSGRPVAPSGLATKRPTKPRGVAVATTTLRIEFPWKQACRPCCHAD